MDTLLLPTELSIYTVAELHPQWLTWAGQGALAGREALADGHAVDQVDGAGLQLLLSLQRCLANRGCALRLQGASHALREACAALGLTGWLDGLLQPLTAEAA